MVRDFRVIVLIAVALVGVGLGLLWQMQRSPGVMLRAAIPAVDPTRPEGSPFTAEHHVLIARIYNDIGRKTRWSDADRAFVLETITGVWPDDFDTKTSRTHWEAWDGHRTMLTILSDRIRMGALTDQEVLLAYRDAVLGLLEHPNPQLRRYGASSTGNSYMLVVPEIRAKVENMAANDPDEQVRRAARIKLDQYDGAPRTGDPCPTCPGGVAP